MVFPITMLMIIAVNFNCLAAKPMLSSDTMTAADGFEVQQLPPISHLLIFIMVRKRKSNLVIDEKFQNGKIIYLFLK